MPNPRENIKYDIPKEWVENFKKGCCPVCGKTKFEFDKGQKVYCSKKCAEEYGERIYTWQQLVEKILEKRGKKCEKCGNTSSKKEKEFMRLKKETIINYIESHPELIELKRKELMDKAEEYYQKALKYDEYVESLKGKEDKYSDLDWDMRVDIPYEVTNKFEYPRIGFEIDHIKAVINGGDMWDEKNLQVLCDECHKKKTKEDMLERKRKKIKTKVLEGEIRNNRLK